VGAPGESVENNARHRRGQPPALCAWRRMIRLISKRIARSEQDRAADGQASAEAESLVATLAILADAVSFGIRQEERRQKGDGGNRH